MAKPNQNHYEILQVRRNASIEEIKKSYKKLSNKYHPDKLVGKSEEVIRASQEKFTIINNAYQVLRNEESRKAYDLLLDEHQEIKHTVHQSQYHERPAQFQFNINRVPIFANAPPSSFGLSTNIYYNLELPIKAILNGCSVDVSLDVVRFVQNKESGKVMAKKFKSSGQIFIPPSKIGDRFVIENISHQGYNNRLGSLVITLSNYNLFCTYDESDEIQFYLYLSDKQLRDGGIFEIDYFDESKLKVRIPPNTKTESVFTLKGKGYYNRDAKLIVKRITLANKLVETIINWSPLLVLLTFGYALSKVWMSIGHK